MVGMSVTLDREICIVCLFEIEIFEIVLSFDKEIFICFIDDFMLNEEIFIFNIFESDICETKVSFDKEIFVFDIFSGLRFSK